MASQIEIKKDGTGSAFYVGRVAWHGLGTVVKDAPTIEEGIKLAGLEWDVSIHPMDATVLLPNRDPFTVTAETRMVIRESDGKKLGEVGPNWHPLQNNEAFEWFQPFLDSGDAKLEAAGSLFEGRRIWVLAKINRDPMEIVPGDEVEKYILLANGHDDTFSAHCGFTGTRVVCNNLLMMALGNAKSKILKVRHSKKIKENLESVRDIMDMADAAFNATLEQYKLLASKQINTAQLKEYIKIIFKAPKKDDEGNDVEDDKVRKKKITEEDPRLIENKIIPLFEGGQGNKLPGVRGTLWAGFNAITEFLTHQRGRSQDARLNSLWFGQAQGDGGAITKRALKAGLDMIV